MEMKIALVLFQTATVVPWALIGTYVGVNTRSMTRLTTKGVLTKIDVASTDDGNVKGLSVVVCVVPSSLVSAGRNAG